MRHGDALYLLGNVLDRSIRVIEILFGRIQKPQLAAVKGLDDERGMGCADELDSWECLFQVADHLSLPLRV